tara:strand:+ start:15827 stop:16147 length:321 start_codon:yes stop_codon:yes gene_type:complete
MFDANSTTQEIEFDQHDKTMAALTSGQSCLTSVFHKQEFRMYDREAGATRKFQPRKLLAIIVGRRVGDKKIEVVEKRVPDFNARNETNVRVLYAHCVASTYIVGWG